MDTNVKEKEYGWLAVYADGGILPQYSEDGSEAAYGAINRDTLAEFHILDKETNESVFSMSLEPDQRLIYRRRVSMSEAGIQNWVILLVGWQQTVNGKNVQSINWILPSGQIVNTGKFREDHPVFYGVELMGFEKEELPESSLD